MFPVIEIYFFLESWRWTLWTGMDLMDIVDDVEIVTPAHAGIQEGPQ
jgi:hypothetical protein